MFGADEIKTGIVSEAISAETPVGEKPAAIAAEQISAVVTIEAIDLENKAQIRSGVKKEIKKNRID